MSSRNFGRVFRDLRQSNAALFENEAALAKDYAGLEENEALLSNRVSSLQQRLEVQQQAITALQNSLVFYNALRYALFAVLAVAATGLALASIAFGDSRSAATPTASPTSFPTMAPTAQDASDFTLLSRRFWFQETVASGNHAVSRDVVVPPGCGVVKLYAIRFRVDYPAAANENILFRFYRYRKTGPLGSFSYSQITDALTITSGTPWSWWNDGPYIRNGFYLNDTTDVVVLSTVHTVGSNWVRALNILWSYECADAELFMEPPPTAAPLGNGTAIWPPGS